MLHISWPIIKKLIDIKLQSKPIKTTKRSILITKALINKVMSIHNGKIFTNLLVTDKILNKKLGEFSLTRKYPKHPIKDKNLKKKNK